MARKNTKNSKKDEKRVRFSFFSSLTPEKKSAILKYTGLTIFVFTLFTFISAFSYLFTWKADQSLLVHPDMLDKAVEVSNWGGKFGYRWSSFLVTDCFGLGSFALVFLMGAVAYQMFFWNKRIGLLRMAFVVLSGTFLMSLILSFFSTGSVSDTFCGGGLGGYAGAAVIEWMTNLVKEIITGLILLVMSVAWLIMSSRRFAFWFASVGEVTDTAVEDVEESVQVEMGVSESELPEPDIESKEEGPDDSDPFTEIEVEPVIEPEADPVIVDEPVVIEENPQENTGIEVIRAEELVTEVTEELPRFDNRMELERFEFPSLELLKD